MYQGEKNVKINKNIVIIVVSFILVLGVVILGTMIWQKKQSIQIKQNAQLQNNLKTENNTIGGNNSTGVEKNNEEQELAKVSTLAFDNQQMLVKNNEKLSLKAIVDPKGKKISAAELHIVFDSKTLKLENITPSNVFSTVLSKANIDNGKGTASIMLGVPLGNPNPDSEPVVIAIFDFQVISGSIENTQISFTDQTAVAAADGKGAINILASKTPAMITIQR